MFIKIKTYAKIFSRLYAKLLNFLKASLKKEDRMLPNIETLYLIMTKKWETEIAL